ncbi:MAG: tetratricopeptide repeat protein [Verrucomicrobiae bacterium]|nr:tetratricopeptide repeat protein [Verrucomicrobiae bacterium]
MKKLFALFGAVGGLMMAGCSPFNPQDEVNAGAEALARTNLVQAVFLLESAARGLPNDARCQNLYGQALFLFGKPAEAANAFRRAIACNSNDPAPHYNLGVAAFAQRDYPTAVESFQNCLMLAPQNVSARLFLGAAHLRLGDLDAAYRETRAALDLEPQNPDAVNNLAVIAHRHGRPTDAEARLNELMQRFPDYAPAHLNLARLYELDLKDKRRALEHYRRYAALEPASPHRLAVSRSTRVLELDLNLPPTPPLPPLASAPPVPQPVTAAPAPPAATATNPPAAAPPPAPPAPVAAVVPQAPQPPGALHAQVDQLKAAGRNRDAAEVALALGDYYLQQRDTNNASNAYMQAVDLDPQNPLTHFRLGDLFQQQGRKPAALQSFQEAAQLNPDFLAALRRVAPLAAELNQPLVAVAAYKRITELDPNDTNALFRLADLQDRALKNRPAAEQTYQLFLKKFPNAAEAKVVRARLSAKPAAPARETARPATAASAPQKKSAATAGPPPVTAQPTPPPPPPDPRTAAEIYRAGAALLQRNAFAEAEPEFLAVLRKDPNHAQAHLALGRIYSQRVETQDKARAHYTRFLQLAPDDPKAPAVRGWLSVVR